MRYAKEGNAGVARAARLERSRPWLHVVAIAWLAWSLTAGAPPAWGASASVHRVEGLSAPGSRASGMPETLLPVGDRFVYVAHSGDQAPARLLLWASDGSAAGTEALRELCVDCGVEAAASTGTVAFFAVCEVGWCDGEHGETRLWRSDGSPGGTYPLVSRSQTFVPALVVAGDFAYFLACGRQCSVTASDGTVEGTQPLVVPGIVGWTAPLTVLNGEAYLSSEGPSSHGSTLWRLSARSGEAERVHDFPDAPCVTAVPSISRLVLVLEGDLWASDGTSVGTTLLRHFQDLDRPLKGGCVVADRRGRAWFVATELGTGEQLWSTDGTAAGTRPATNFAQRHPFGFPPSYELPVLAGGQLAGVGPRRLLFPALDEDTHRRLWTTNGNRRGARPITGCRGGCPDVVGTQPFAPLGGRVAFIGRRAGEREAMWITDGTGRGTVKVHDAPAAEGGLPDYFLPWVTAREDRWYLSTPADSDAGPGDRNTLWVSDGTPGGTVELGTTESVDEASLLESMLFAFAGRVYFPGCAGDDCGLLATDGRAAGAVRTVTFEGDSVLTDGDELVALAGSHVLLTGASSFWLADAADAVELPESATGPFDTYNWWRVEAAGSGDRTFVLSHFHAGTVSFGDSFWSTDGTVAGTTLLEGPYPATVRTMAPWREGQVLFASLRYSSTDGYVPSLGTSDGTLAGTVRFVDLPAHLYPGALITHDAVALFVLSSNYTLEGDLGLWISDGTAAGTHALTSSFDTLGAPVVLGNRAYALASRAGGEPTLLVVDLASQAVSEVALAPLGVERAGLTAAAGRLWLTAQGADDTELSLWVSDGSAAGTQRLPAAVATWEAGRLTAFGDAVYFIGTDAAHGRELWRSDGTAAGTGLVVDLAPGLADGAPQSTMVDWAGRLYFAADDGLRGPELWSSDGTAAGTRLAIDLTAGPTGSSPTDLTIAGDRLFFVADDGVTGWQLWVMDPPRPLMQPP